MLCVCGVCCLFALLVWFLILSVLICVDIFGLIAYATWLFVELRFWV